MSASTSGGREPASKGGRQTAGGLPGLVRLVTATWLLSVTAGLLALLGLAWIVAPETMLASWGLSTDPGIVYMSRRYAVMFIPLAAILWLSRTGPSRRPALIGALVGSAVMAAMSLMGLATGTVSSLGLLSLGVESLLAVVYAWATATGLGTA